MAWARIRGAVTALLCGLGTAMIVGCQPEESGRPPAAVEPTREAITYYGRMILVDHRGPKAQIHLGGADEPLWFSQVRDAVAFTLSPEESSDIAAIYVTDMARADGWAQPQQWIAAEEAVYVIDSECRGGMGALEAVPFSQREAAEAFIELHGGEPVAWDEIPADYIQERSIEAIDSPNMMGSGEGCERLVPEGG
ncbi:nitrous oxide reductase accessory protein NosL [Arhodomonas sp. SL1]|uniref:nitrous oxide reductase accessory protein NosL n=1 Tax=Arhodomonas sp. SL1 TaxID=3425691 RepID=UPI003F8817A6